MFLSNYKDKLMVYEMETKGKSREGDISLPLRELPQAKTISPAPIVSKSLRRKTSFSIHSTSSDLSLHDSIYDAVYISPIGSEDNGQNKIHLINIPPRKKSTPPENCEENNENRKKFPATVDTPVPLSDDAEFLYGHGTPLETITEQKSYTTMKSLAQSKSTDEIPSTLSLQHRDSLVLAKNLRRQQSFSLDDIILINKTYHDACAIIEREIHKPFLGHEIYAQPKVPIHAPPERTKTPPGMPSWTAAQSQPRSRIVSQQPTQNRIQRWLGLPPSEPMYSSRVASSSIENTMSIPGRIAPKFKPPKSVYGALDQHPFTKAEIFQITGISQPAAMRSVFEPSHRSRERNPFNPKLKNGPEQRVRFTSPAIAIDSERVSPLAEADSTHSNQLHLTNANTASFHETPQKQKQCPHMKGRRAALKALNHPEAQISSNPFSSSPSALLATNSSTQPSISSQSSPSSSPMHFKSSPSRNSRLSGQDGFVIDSQPIRSLSVSSANYRKSSPFGQSPLNGLNPQPTRSLSVSSTTYLMRNANERDTYSITENMAKKKSGSCWKCRIEKVFDQIDQLWTRTASCLCLICCGFDVQDGATHPNNYARAGSGFSPNGTRMRGGWCEEDLAPRVVNLQEAAVL